MSIRMIDIVIGLVIVGVVVSTALLRGIDVMVMVNMEMVKSKAKAKAITAAKTTTTLSQSKLFATSEDITKVPSSKETYVNVSTENNPDKTKTFVLE